MSLQSPMAVIALMEMLRLLQTNSLISIQIEAMALLITIVMVHLQKNLQCLVLVIAGVPL